MIRFVVLKKGIKKSVNTKGGEIDDFEKKRWVGGSAKGNT